MVVTLRASWFNLIKFITNFVTRNKNDKNLWRKDWAPPPWFVCLMMLTYLQESLSCQFKNLRRANDICVLILCLSWIKPLYDTAYHTYTEIHSRRRKKQERKTISCTFIMASWIYHLIFWCFDFSLPGFKYSGGKSSSYQRQNVCSSNFALHTSTSCASLWDFGGKWRHWAFRTIFVVFASQPFCVWGFKQTWIGSESQGTCFFPHRKLQRPLSYPWASQIH